MSDGEIKLVGLIEPGSTVTYKQIASGVGVLIGRFLRGAHDKFVYCVSEEDFKNYFGEEALTGYELDFEFAIAFFRASEENGRLWVRNVYAYDADAWDGVTAAKAIMCDPITLALMTDKRIYFEAYSRGEWPHDGKKKLRVLIRETTQRAALSGYCDILIYYNGSIKKSYLNLCTDPSLDSVRNIRDSIPAEGDGWIIPHYADTTKSMPDYKTTYATAYQFTGGNNGLTSLLGVALAAKHWLGEVHATGNSGLYGIIPYLNNVERRPTFIINQLGNESYEWDHYSNLTTFCRSYWLTHFSTPPSGRTRDQVSAWKIGSGADDRSTLYGEARVCWPWYYPRNSSNKTLVIPASSADAGRMVARIASSGGHVHEAHAGTDGDHGSLAMVTTRLERETGQDDLDALNPLGIAVINSSIGGIYIDGSRTMATDYRFLEINMRRHLAVCIMAGILAQSRWMIHGPNDAGYENSPGIWTRGTLSGQAYMRKFASDGAFASKTMGVGWSFILGTPYTTAEDIAQRIARSRIGYVPRSCAETIYFYLGVEEGQLNAAPAPATT